MDGLTPLADGLKRYCKCPGNHCFDRAVQCESLVADSLDSKGYPRTAKRRLARTDVDGVVVDIDDGKRFKLKKMKEAWAVVEAPGSSAFAFAAHACAQECEPVEPAEAPTSTHLPLLPDLPPLPPLNDCTPGKYISKCTVRNGFASRVVYFHGGKQAVAACWHGDCKRQPQFGPIGTFGAKHALYCEKHADSTVHENVTNKRCAHDGCKTRPHFGPIGTFGAEHALYCSKHADRTVHENVISKRCAHDGCKTQPKFGPIGTFGAKHALYCEKHSDRTVHEDVISKRCAHDGCKTQPHFGPIGTFGAKHALYCEKHADSTVHEDVINNRCKHDGCKKRSTFGPIGTFGEKHALYCEKHADRTVHENVAAKRCAHGDCKRRPHFGPIGTFGAKHALYCSKHADRTVHENVVAKRCVHKGCKLHPTFGPIGTFGAKHALYCEKHADKSVHENVAQKRCIGYNFRGDPDDPHPCDNGTLINGDKYDHRCVKCFCASFPNDPRAINAKKWLKAREQTVVAVLTAAFPQYRWTLDRAFAVGVLVRPDARVAVGDRVVLVEIDEDSHRSYECSKERARETEFYRHQSKGATLVMIRFNPDAYVDLGGAEHASCFKYNKASGTVVVDPAQKTQWTARCDTLVDTVAYFLDPLEYVPTPTEAGQDRLILTTELFYDNIADMPEAERDKVLARKKAIGKKRKREAEKVRVESS